MKNLRIKNDIHITIGGVLSVPDFSSMHFSTGISLNLNISCQLQMTLKYVMTYKYCTYNWCQALFQHQASLLWTSACLMIFQILFIVA